MPFKIGQLGEARVSCELLETIEIQPEMPCLVRVGAERQQAAAETAVARDQREVRVGVGCGVLEPRAVELQRAPACDQREEDPVDDRQIGRQVDLCAVRQIPQPVGQVRQYVVAVSFRETEHLFKVFADQLRNIFLRVVEKVEIGASGQLVHRPDDQVDARVVVKHARDLGRLRDLSDLGAAEQRQPLEPLLCTEGLVHRAGKRATEAVGEFLGLLRVVVIRVKKAVDLDMVGDRHDAQPEPFRGGNALCDGLVCRVVGMVRVCMKVCQQGGHLFLQYYTTVLLFFQ